VRGAIATVGQGQRDAARALGLSAAQSWRTVVLPQAMVVALPSFGNLLIELLKATSLVSLITLSDLAFRAQTLNQATFKTVPIFTLVLLMYLALSLVLTIGMRWLENRAALGLARGRAR
jgi:polar amino acid transport system permease protein